MHELSLANEVIDLASREAKKNHIDSVSEIVIEIGDLSGVEADIFQSALEMIVKDTILENAALHLIRTSGQGKCNACNKDFEMKNRLDVCPVCSCFPSEISGGQEFRVLSISGE